MDTLLVVAPHADDEVLGCGGTLARWPGGKHILIVTHEQRNEQQTRRVRNLLHADYHLATFPDAGLEPKHIPGIAETIATIIHQHAPSTVLCPFLYDVHSDHRVVAEACLSIKPFRFPGVKRVLSYEVPSQTDLGIQAFRPTVFVDITKHLLAKLEAWAVYHGEVNGSRDAGIIESLAKYRGGTAAMNYAEAFELIREVE